MNPEVATARQTLPGEPIKDTAAQKQRLVEEHISYARAIATDMTASQSGIDREELLSAAEFGLVQAAEAFDAARGVTFPTFAYYRIRGSVFDYLRRLGRQRKFEVAANDYMMDRSALATANGAETDQIQAQQVAGNIMTCYVLFHDSDIAADEVGSANPEQRILSKEMWLQMRSAVEALPERNRKVISDYYFREMSLDQIGAELGLSKSWVSRIHARSIEMLRESCVAMGTIDHQGPRFTQQRMTGIR